MSADEPIVYIKDRELLYIEGLKQAGLATEWHTNLGFVKEEGDVGLYTHPPTKTVPKPMTKEEVMKCYPPEYEAGPFAMRRWLFDFARNIERHHGILDTE